MSLLYWISVRASRAGRARVSVPDLAMGRKEGWGLGGACSPADFHSQKVRQISNIGIFIQVSLTVEKTKYNDQCTCVPKFSFSSDLHPWYNLRGYTGCLKIWISEIIRNCEVVAGCCRSRDLPSLGCWLLSQPSPPQLERSFLLEISKYILQNTIRMATFQPFHSYRATCDMWYTPIQVTTRTHSWAYIGMIPVGNIYLVRTWYLGYSGVRTACKK